mmetsp:Transcript_12968/g.35283  ORF Transcript_12968/g.35283 Transcript_12968/m.35283 type:complete len:282 (+) Transcript_12968:385-1230(+)
MHLARLAADLVPDARLEAPVLFQELPLLLVRRLASQACGRDMEPLLHHESIEALLQPVRLSRIEPTPVLHARDERAEGVHLLIQGINLPLLLNALALPSSISLLLHDLGMHPLAPLADGAVALEALALLAVEGSRGAVLLVAPVQGLQDAVLLCDASRAERDGLAPARDLLVLLRQLPLRFGHAPPEPRHLRSNVLRRPLKDRVAIPRSCLHLRRERAHGTRGLVQGHLRLLHLASEPAHLDVPGLHFGAENPQLHLSRGDLFREVAGVEVWPLLRRGHRR